MLNTQLSNRTVNRQAQSIIDDLDDGYFEIYTAPQPPNADTPVAAQQLLAQLRFASPAAPAPVDGVINFTNPDPVNGLLTGNAAFYRWLMADGVTVVMDGSIGTTQANMILNNIKIVSGAKVTLTAVSHTVEKSGAGY
jgi:hypothetical protein